MCILPETPGNNIFKIYLIIWITYFIFIKVNKYLNYKLPYHFWNKIGKDVREYYVCFKITVFIRNASFSRNTTFFFVDLLSQIKRSFCVAEKILNFIPTLEAMRVFTTAFLL